MRPEELKNYALYISGVAIPFIFTCLLTPQGTLNKIVFYISVTGLEVSTFLFIFNIQLSRFIWLFKHKYRLKKSIIAIIDEGDLEPEKSRFKPDYWEKLIKNGYRIEKISALIPEKISMRYVAVINPYGECYPEKDMGERTTFKQIKKYVNEGGIFVSTCGCAFWYAWNKDVGKISTAAEVYGLHGLSSPTNQILIFQTQQGAQQISVSAPIYDINISDQTYDPNPRQSLTDTLTFNELRLLTTTGAPRLINIIQTDKEKQKYGDITKIANNGFIFEFRAIRKPSQNFKPIVRALIPNPADPDKPIDIFPLAYVPYGDGKFLFAGMHMDLKSNENENNYVILTDVEEQFHTNWIDIYQFFTDEIIEKQPKMVYKTLESLIEEEKRKSMLCLFSGKTFDEEIKNGKNMKIKHIFNKIIKQKN